MKILIPALLALLLVGCQEPVPDTQNTQNSTVNSTTVNGSSTAINGSTEHPQLQPSAAVKVQ